MRAGYLRPPSTSGRHLALTAPTDPRLDEVIDLTIEHGGGVAAFIAAKHDAPASAVRFDGGEKRRFQPLWLRAWRYVQIDVQTGEAPLTIDDDFKL